MRRHRFTIAWLSLIVCASSALSADGATWQTSAAALPVTEIAPGVFFHAGQQAEENRENDGDIANIGFIVGRRCVAVIDSGGSPDVGAALSRAIGSKTSLPVCYVINTHMHPDHVLGNRAFAGNETQFIAADGLARALTARAGTYLDRLAHALGKPADTSWIVLPDDTVADRKILDLGDRRLRLEAWPTAHTDNDLTVFDEKTGTLWLGDLLFVDRVPSIDGSVTGWLSVLAELAERDDVAHAIPGHGPPNDHPRSAFVAEKRYLEAVRQGAQKALDDGRSLRWAQRHVAQEERSNWLLFDDYNPRNVTAAYTELEWQ